MHDRQALDLSLRQLLHTADATGALGPDALADRLADVLHAAHSVLGVDGAGLMLLDEHGDLCVVGVSDAPSAVLERAQQVLGSGPGVDCVREARTVTVDDLADSAPYRRLWDVLREDGEEAFRAVVSAPVLVSGEVLGTLNVMAEAPRRWTPEQAGAVAAYANVISVFLRLGAAAREE